jgi:hypothetical protein
VSKIKKRNVTRKDLDPGDILSSITKGKKGEGQGTNMTPLNGASRFAAIIFLSAILIGCAQPKMVHVDYDQRASHIRAIGVLAPNLAYYDLTWGGIREKNDTWSEQANQNVAAAIKDVLSAKGFEMKTIVREGERKQTLEEIADLFNTIAWSHRNHVVVARQIDIFSHKAASFDYSVGPIDEILDAYQVDALILAEGGGSGNSAFMRGGTVLLIALVDRTGALLWYERYARPEGGFPKKDVRDPDSVRAIIGEIFEKMPAVHK